LLSIRIVEVHNVLYGHYGQPFFDKYIANPFASLNFCNLEENGIFYGDPLKIDDIYKLYYFISPRKISCPHDGERVEVCHCEKCKAFCGNPQIILKFQIYSLEDIVVNCDIKNYIYDL